MTKLWLPFLVCCLVLSGNLFSAEEKSRPAEAKSFVGSWLLDERQSVQEFPYPRSGESILHFKEDGGLEAIVLMDQRTRGVMEGKWKFEDGKLKLNFSSKDIHSGDLIFENPQVAGEDKIVFGREEENKRRMIRLKKFAIPGREFSDSAGKNVKYYYIVTMGDGRMVGFDMAQKSGEDFQLLSQHYGENRSLNTLTVVVDPFADGRKVQFDIRFSINEKMEPVWEGNAGKRIGPEVRLLGEENLGFNLKCYGSVPSDLF